MMSASTPYFASLMDDPRFADVAEQLIGGPVIPIAADGNRHVDDTSMSLCHSGLFWSIFWSISEHFVSFDDRMAR